MEVQVKTEDRIRKGIVFLRGTNSLSDTQMYRKSVLKFLELVEELVGKEKTSEDQAKEAGLI